MSLNWHKKKKKNIVIQPGICSKITVILILKLYIFILFNFRVNFKFKKLYFPHLFFLMYLKCFIKVKKKNFFEQFNKTHHCLSLFLLLPNIYFFSSSADCDSYCKASKGKLKINMKKYCNKDYGKTDVLSSLWSISTSIWSCRLL